MKIAIMQPYFFPYIGYWQLIHAVDAVSYTHLGYLGLHRFYEGKIWTGILWLCTGGLLGVGIVVDAILIVMKPEHY